MNKDILKKLSFGVKKTTPKQNLKECSQLISRVLPEEIREELLTLREQLSSSAKKPTQKITKKRKLDSDITIFSNQKATSEENDEIQEKGRLEKKYAEKIAQLRRLNRIFSLGTDIPDPILDFSSLKQIPQQVQDALDQFGINNPSPIQMQSIPLMINRRNVLCCAPTGSGKTLAFILPALIDIHKYKSSVKATQEKKLLAIILEPTRELASQTYKQFLKYGSDIDVSYALFESEDFPKNAEVLVTTPNRLVHHLKNICLDELRWLIVDESDRLFEVVEGDDRCFRTQLAKIYTACDNKQSRKAFFSATFSYEVENWCKENLENIAVVCIGARNSSNTNVHQKLIFAGSEYGKIVALKDILMNKFTPSALIFVQSKQRARELFVALSNLPNPIPIGIISSERSPEEREKTVEEFRAGKTWILICTELLGRGLDLKNVSMVFNFDLPTSIVSYIHRVGRTGRAGRQGEAITFFTEADLKHLRPIATVISQAGFEVPEYTLSLKQMSRNEKHDLQKHAPKRKHIAFIPKSKFKKMQEKKGVTSKVIQKKSKVSEATKAPASGDKVKKLNVKKDKTIVKKTVKKVKSKVVA